ncbi:dihydrodipicolinate synthase family protein [Actinotalea sp. K2]|uniref:dihydrodipicolinate synthase family protein n=1 Tax=Actinotalea sp. K2 TaxID=2939438 RepID=UPI00201751E7|nr:dihydrodipicolinate synthase family protein [Actinotalea sp. K2]MCL3861206.1 dihydrodipicolinate synthase family protein [Actinotalea sp. K2]
MTGSSVLPDGAWPVMLTPFCEDRSIDWDGVDAYTDWLIELGSAGIFAVALSSEMYELTHEERVALAARVVDRAAGRVPVVASSVHSGLVEDQAVGVGQMAATGVSAVVLISSLVAGLDETEETWLANVRTIVDLSPGVDLGIYECPVPYKRLPSLDAVRWMAASGRFTFYKDTSHTLELMGERLSVMRGSRLKLYNAAIGSLLPSLQLGASGLSGYAANVYPDLVSWLCRHAASGDAATVVALQRLLTVTEHAVNLRYPSSAKYLLDVGSRLTFRPISRWKPEVIGAHEGLPLQQLAEYIRDLGLPRDALDARR